MLRHFDPTMRQYSVALSPLGLETVLGGFRRLYREGVVRGFSSFRQHHSEGGASVTAVWIARKRSVPLRDPELQGRGKPCEYHTHIRPGYQLKCDCPANDAPARGRFEHPCQQSLVPVQGRWPPGSSEFTFCRASPCHQQGAQHRRAAQVAESREASRVRSRIRGRDARSLSLRCWGAMS